MYVAGSLVQLKHGAFEFKACNATGNGGALSIENNVTLGGSSSFEDCTSGDMFDRSSIVRGKQGW